jgi:hypothetical protein
MPFTIVGIGSVSVVSLSRTSSGGVQGGGAECPAASINQLDMLTIILA